VGGARPREGGGSALVSLGLRRGCIRDGISPEVRRWGVGGRLGAHGQLVGSGDDGGGGTRLCTGKIGDWIRWRARAWWGGDAPWRKLGRGGAWVEGRWSSGHAAEEEERPGVAWWCGYVGRKKKIRFDD